MSVLRIRTSLAVQLLLIFTFCETSAGAAMLHGRVQESTYPARAANISSHENINFAAFLGRWHCTSVVTESRAPNIASGTVATSEIEFDKLTDGRMQANWWQQEWSPSSACIVHFTAGGLAALSRINYSQAPGQQTVAAQSFDLLKLDDDGTISSHSIVDQYLNGLLVGTYKTKSFLQRVN